MLNNQPMGFYHPATLVKDAQRHGVSFAPIDVQVVRLGMPRRARRPRAAGTDVCEWVAAGDGPRYRGESRPRLADSRARGSAGPRGQLVRTRWNSRRQFDRCPKCGNDDQSMLEDTQEGGRFCNICAHEWSDSAQTWPLPYRVSSPRARTPRPRTREPANRETRFTSIEDLITRTGIRRDELATLAEIGALNAFGHDRRSALWQIERAARPAGELFAGQDVEDTPAAAADARPGAAAPARSPLRAMTPSERLMSDYSGTSLTIGPHPLALRRMELALRGVLRAIDLPRGRHGRRVRVAGAVITRQRPGHRQRIRLPHARRRNRHRQHHRPAGPVHRPSARPSSVRRI